MKSSQSLQLYTVLLIFLSTFATAWPWPKWLPELEALVVRQDGNDNHATNTAPTAAQPANSGKASASAGNSKGGSTTTPTVSVTGSASDNPKATDDTKSNATTTVHHSTSYDDLLPAGAVAMITPAPLSGSQYFKIGDFVTFAWNYTDLLATPSAINVMATCTANQQLYTLAANQTVGNSTGAVTWDTGSYQATAVSDPLLTEIYTLIIYDAESSISATAQPGYLAVFNQFTFGMYTPQPYVPLDQFICATCSGALSDMERRALGMVVGMSVITVLSFTWFVSGLGVIW